MLQMRPSLAEQLQVLLVVLILTSAWTRHAHYAREASSAFTENGSAFCHGKSTTLRGAQRKSLEHGTGFPVFGREPFLCTTRRASGARGAAVLTEPLPPATLPAVAAGAGAPVVVSLARWYLSCRRRRPGGYAASCNRCSVALCSMRLLFALFIQSRVTP